MVSWWIWKLVVWWIWKLMYWWVDKLASWWNDKLTAWQVGEMASWQHGKLVKWQVDSQTSWWNGKLTKFNNKFWTWLNHNWWSERIQWKVDKMASRGNVTLMKSPSTVFSSVSVNHFCFPGSNVIKLFTTVITNVHNMLECLYQTKLSILVKCLWVKAGAYPKVEHSKSTSLL